MSCTSRSLEEQEDSGDSRLVPASRPESLKSNLGDPQTQPKVVICTNNLELNYSESPSPGDEFSKFPSEVQDVIIKAWVDKGRHKIAYDNRQQWMDFVINFLKLFFSFILGLALIAGSILLIKSGYTGEGIAGLAGTGIFEAFVWREHKKGNGRK